jgi:hypothetical protein
MSFFSNGRFLTVAALFVLLTGQIPISSAAQGSGAVPSKAKVDDARARVNDPNVPPPLAP